MSAPEAPAKPAQESVWQRMLRQEGIARKRSLWAFLLGAALLVIGLDLMVEHWLANVAGVAAVGLTAMLILDMVRDRWQRRREARLVAEIARRRG